MKTSNRLLFVGARAEVLRSATYMAGFSNAKPETASKQNDTLPKLRDNGFPNVGAASHNKFPRTCVTNNCCTTIWKYVPEVLPNTDSGSVSFSRVFGAKHDKRKKRVPTIKNNKKRRTNDYKNENQRLKTTKNENKRLQKREPTTKNNKKRVPTTKNNQKREQTTTKTRTNDYKNENQRLPTTPNNCVLVFGILFLCLCCTSSHGPLIIGMGRAFESNISHWREVGAPLPDRKDCMVTGLVSMWFGLTTPP